MHIPKLFSKYDTNAGCFKLVELDETQHKVIRSIVNEDPKEDLHLVTGPAGSGKSFFISALKSFHNVALTATTARAAFLINANTIDSLLLFNRTTNTFSSLERLTDIMRSLPKDIILDEGPMLGARSFEPIYNLLRDYGKRLIIVGDFAQAPPVKDIWINNSPLWKPTVHKLSANHRQSKGEFLDILNKLRLGTVDDEVDEFFTTKSFQPNGSLDDAIILYASNAKAKKYNEARLDKLSGEEFTTRASISSGSGAYLDLKPREKDKIYADCGVAHKDNFVVGAKVILTKNNYEEGYINSDVGYIENIEAGPAKTHSQCEFGFDEEDREAISFDIRLERNKSLVRLTKIVQNIPGPDGEIKYIVKGFPLRLGWAVTIHKSQGGTFDRVHFDMQSLRGYLWAARKSLEEDPNNTYTKEELDYEARKALHGLVYVGTSRVTTAEGLSISGWDPKYVFCDPFVKDLL